MRFKNNKFCTLRKIRFKQRSTFPDRPIQGFVSHNKNAQITVSNIQEMSKSNNNTNKTGH